MSSQVEKSEKITDPEPMPIEHSLIRAQSLEEFFACLEKTESETSAQGSPEFPLGMNATELALSINAFLELQIELVMSEQEIPKKTTFIDWQISEFVDGLQLPASRELSEHIAQLVRGEYVRLAAPELFEAFSGELVQELNDAHSFIEFRHILSARLPVVRAKYIWQSLLKSLFSVVADTSNSGLNIEEDVLASLERDSPIPPEVHHRHVARLLIATLGSDILDEKTPE